ncbi:unnamed protein product, partial [Staurois parvus]
MTKSLTTFGEGGGAEDAVPFTKCSASHACAVGTRLSQKKPAWEDCTVLDQGTGKVLLQRRAERPARYSDTAAV